MFFVLRSVFCIVFLYVVSLCTGTELVWGGGGYSAENFSGSTAVQ